MGIFGFIVMWLWNALLPELFKLPAISYWQAVGLFLLSRILLGGFGGGRGGPGGRGHPGEEHRKEFLHHMRERWQDMDPEQREKFRRKLKKRWDIDFEEEMPQQPEE